MKRRSNPLLRRLRFEALEPRTALSANGLPDSSSLEMPGFPDVTIAMAEAVEAAMVQLPLPGPVMILSELPEVTAAGQMMTQTLVPVTGNALSPAALLMIADDWPD